MSAAKSSSSKRKQEETISIPPPSSSSSSSEDPSSKKKAKGAGAEAPQLISVRIYNSGETGFSVVAIDRVVLMRMSDFFKTLVENLGEGESEIALEEKEVYKAAALLPELAEHYNHEAAPPVQVCWNKSKATMSEKWLVEDYVNAYGAVIEKHLQDVMSKGPVDLAGMEVSGFTRWSNQDPATATRVASTVNGIYDKTDEVAGGQPIYSRRGLTEGGKQLIIEYHQPNKMWQIKWLENKGTDRACAYVTCDPPVLPHRIEGVWKVYDRDAPGAELKFIAQPAAKVSRIPAPPSADVLLFWEMIGTIFQHVGLMRGPIHSMEDLVEVLLTRKDLRVVEEMKKVMTVDALLLLVDHLP